MRSAVKILFFSIKDQKDAWSQYICASPKTKKIAIKQFLDLCSKENIETDLVDKNTIKMVKNEYFIRFNIVTELG